MRKSRLQRQVVQTTCQKKYYNLQMCKHIIYRQTVKAIYIIIAP